MLWIVELPGETGKGLVGTHHGEILRLQKKGPDRFERPGLSQSDRS